MLSSCGVNPEKKGVILFRDQLTINPLSVCENRLSNYINHPVPEAGLRLKKYSEAGTCHF